jgi:hypothetical protein
MPLEPVLLNLKEQSIRIQKRPLIAHFEDNKKRNYIQLLI